MPKPRTHRAARARKKIGLAPGTAVYTGDATDVDVRGAVFDYDADELQENANASWDRIREARDSPTTTWVDIVGLHDVEALGGVTSHFGLHGLALEDLLGTDTRPKVEDIGDHTLVVLKMATLDGSSLAVEHVGFVLGPTWVLTFQERPGDVFEAVRERLRNPSSRLRRLGSDYLLHALMDAVVDGYFQVLDHYEQIADALETEAMGQASPDFPGRSHRYTSDLRRLRRLIWPLRTRFAVLQHDANPRITDEVRPYMRDLGDNVGLAMDIVESNIDRLGAVFELHLAIVSNRMNEVMRVLTIVTTLFVPMTFLAGIYGMNFQYMPELQYAWGYPVALTVMAALGGGLLAWMHRQGWL